MRNIHLCFAATVLLLARPARAEETPPPLGTPLRATHSAEPAMTPMDFILAAPGVFYLPSTPSMQMGGVTAPRRSSVFATIEVGTVFGGGLGLKPTFTFFDTSLSLFSVGGDATSAFQSAGKTYDKGSYLWLGVNPLSAGISWHQTGYVVGAELVPRVEYLHATFSDTSSAHDSASGHAFLLTLSADVHACLEYNLIGMPKNSALCAYAQPALYRDGLFNGFTTGIRFFML